MGRKAKIRLEWDGDRNGLLWAVRDKGEITMPELTEALRAAGYAGCVFTVIVAVREESDFVGWESVDGQEGDAWKLWLVDEGEPCPICGEPAALRYCPKCGTPVTPATDDGRPTGRETEGGRI